MITDSDLRLNHDFVVRFEALRRRHALRDMNDAAVHELATIYSVPFETIRVWRHLRNALAHGVPVNSGQVADQLPLLTRLTDDGALAAPHESRPRVQASTLRRAYRIHAWIDDRLEREMIANGFIAIGSDELGDLSRVSDREVIRPMLLRTMPDRPSQAINLFVGYWRRFLWDATEGDLVVLPLRDRSVAIGEFAGPYHYVSAHDVRARHRRRVAWLAFPDRDAVSTALVKVLNSQHSVLDVPPDLVPELETILADAAG